MKAITKTELNELIISSQINIKILTKQIQILQSRNAHLEIELAQSRVSIDSWMNKFNSCVNWIKQNTNIESAWNEYNKNNKKEQV